MQRETNFDGWLNPSFILAAVLGLITLGLIIVPSLIGPKLVERQATFRIVAEAGPASVLRMMERPTLSALATAAGCRTYTVQAGDRLYDVARSFSTTEISIAQTNNLRNDILTPGQVLIICSSGPISLRPAADPGSMSGDPGQTIDVVMKLTYPTDTHNRKPHWITLAVSLPEEIGPAGVGLMPDTDGATTVERVTLPAPDQPRLPSQQTAMLVENWLSARLTGAQIMSRSQPSNSSQALSSLLAATRPITWQWLFAPSADGEYLFGLDVFSSGEFEVLDASGEMAGVVQTAGKLVWSHDFSITVDEILGIPRQWWLLASATGALLNLILGLIQVFFTP